MVKLLIAVVLVVTILNYGAVEAKIKNLAQLQAIEQLAMSPYPWGEWVKFHAAMSGVDLEPPTSLAAVGDYDEDESDDDYENEPEVIEFLKRSAVAAEADTKKSAKKAKKAPKVTPLKPWEQAIAAKKAAAASSTTPAPDAPPAPEISYEELAKAILGVQDVQPATTTTTAAPLINAKPEDISYEELAKALLALSKN